jgi:acetyl-CoA carboxylase biotin carboxyl carrier protein
MDIRKIRKLIELIQETGVEEIEITEDDGSVRITRQRSGNSPIVTHMPAPMVSTHHQPYSHEPVHAPAQAAPVSKASAELHGTVIRSPMVGTFYRAPSPGASPFVEVGKTVKVGDTLAMIEAMKMFNPIEAEMSGVITAILVENNEPVEFGQPIFTIEAH